jgi:hypothetical protein
VTVQDIKEPRGKKTGDSPDSSPWKTDSDGTRKRGTRALPLEIRLREFFVSLAGVSMLAGDSFTANAIEAKSEELAYGYAKLASVDPRVKRVLTMLLEGSAWTEALIPTLGLAIIVGWHYGAVPDQLGVPMTLANNMVPVTRSQEQSIKAQAARDQAEAQARNGQGGDENAKPQ